MAVFTPHQQGIKASFSPFVAKFIDNSHSDWGEVVFQSSLFLICFPPMARDTEHF